MRPFELSPETVEAMLLSQLPPEETREMLEALSADSINLEIFSHCMEVMSRHAVQVPNIAMKVLDCCGTGGSGKNAYNTSTTVAFILSAGDVPVIKFGNRGITRASGSFDLLEALGIPVRSNLPALPDILADCGLAFLFAPQLYPAFAGFNQLRRALGIPTVFNFIGPLLNPVRPAYRLLGVSNANMQQVIADYLYKTQTAEHAWIVRSESGLDEIDPYGSTNVIQILKDQSNTLALTPLQNASLQTDTIKENLDRFNAIVSGEDTSSNAYDTVCANAAAAFFVAGEVAGLDEGMQLTQYLLDTGAVLEKVNQCRTAHAHYSG